MLPKKSSLAVIFLLTFFLSPSFSHAEESTTKVHIVVKGDTLWDISNKYLHNPFLWPKLWQWNAYIMNPHFIYPGDKIRLLAPDRPAIKKIDLPVIALKPEPEPEKIVEQVEVAPVAESIEETAVLPEPVEEAVGYNIRHLRSSGMITKEELLKSGLILDGRSDKTMLSVGDVIYVTVKEVASPGDIYLVFKPDQKIIHPINSAELGSKIERLGRIKVISYSDKLVTAEIIEAFNVISRGDYVKPWIKLPDHVIVKESPLDIKGYIVSANEDINLYGQNDVVYIDLGSNSGVEPGNLFISYKPEYLKDNYTVPPVTIGRLLVFDVKKNTSSAIIIDSVEEMHPGTMIKTIVR